MVAGLGIRPGGEEFRRTPALEVINRALVETITTPDSRLCISVPPQEGKTSTASRAFPLWSLWRDRTLRIVIVSYSDGLARSISGQIRMDVQTYAPQLGMRLREDTRAKNEWMLAEGGGVYAVGVGGGLSGRPADLMLIDDPVKGRAEAESPAYRQAMQDWWTSVGSARLAPGAPVVIIQTRYHEEDMIGYVLSQEDGDRWRYVNIPAQADHDPAKGETDVLGRQPGEFMQSARGRTIEQWQQRKVTAGARDWAALYQGRPSPQGGDILKEEHWRRYDYPIWVEMEDGTRRVPYHDDQEVLISVDCAFKDNATTDKTKKTRESDYVAIQVWMRRGVNVYLLDQSWGHFDFVKTCQELVRMAARWPDALLKVVEDAANGPAVIATLRSQVGGIVPETPQGSKKARAYATTPFMEAGNVWLPQSDLTTADGSTFAWVDDFIQECSSFPNGSHDDRVDAYSQAVNRLLIQPFVEDGEELVDEATEMADLRGWSVSPY